MGHHLHLLLLCCLCWLQNALGRFVIEQGGLRIKFPENKLPAQDMSLANFGAPEYGGELVGSLVYVDRAYGHPFDCAPAECRYACQPYNESTPAPFKLQRAGTNHIMLVDRGPVRDDMDPCKFAQKVWHAQEAGAQAVIVVNYEDRHTTMEAPDDEEAYKYMRNITIPAAFITATAGDALKDLLKSDDGEPKEVVAVMDWNDVLPRAEKVSWEFWSNSNDQCGPLCDVQKEFIKEFKVVAEELEKGNWTHFEPHYIVWVCPSVYRSSQECRTQCIHHGRYCTPDPDGDLLGGYSGSDVVQENLRQLCVWKLGNDAGQPWHWWEYVTAFGEQCQMADENYNQECAEQVFSQVGGEEWSSLAAFHDCVGDINADQRNDMMEHEMESQRGGGDVGEVYILPTIRINNGQYRGKLGYADVLKAVCAGFNHGLEPGVCSKLVSTNCRPGSQGDTECLASNDGHTQCKDTVDAKGYQCICGDGYISHDNGDGSTSCLQINQCLSREAQEDHKCNCERCACQEKAGGYECVQDLPDVCAENSSDCWKGDHKVNGQTMTFDACTDNIETAKMQMSQGKSRNQTELYKCICPPCFFELEEGGKKSCVPKGNLDLCDLPSGVYSNPGTAGSGMAAWAVFLIVFGCIGAVALAGYAAYRLRIRNAMHQEIRSIMAQYMPLGEEGDKVEREPLSSA